MAFISANTVVSRSPLVPEIALHVARSSHEIFQAAEAPAHASHEHFPPYWAFAWPGGQAMARYLLDNPSIVAGKSVIDIGAGSGIAAIAAAMSGASRVTAVDVDPTAAIAISLNASQNGCEDRIHISTRDVLGDVPDADLVLMSDLVYEPELKLRVGAFLDSMELIGLPVIIGDRATARQPAPGLIELARWCAPLYPPLVDDHFEEGRVWQLATRRTRRGDRPRARGLP